MTTNTRTNTKQHIVHTDQCGCMITNTNILEWLSICCMICFISQFFCGGSAKVEAGGLGACEALLAVQYVAGWTDCLQQAQTLHGQGTSHNESLTSNPTHTSN